MNIFFYICLFLCFFLKVSTCFRQGIYFENYRNAFDHTSVLNNHIMKLENHSSKLLGSVKAEVDSNKYTKADKKIKKLQIKHENSVKRCESLTKRVSDLESIVQGIASVLVNSIEINEMEKKSYGISDIYLDNSFSLIRRPRFVSKEIAYIMHKNNILHPITYSKQSGDDQIMKKKN